MTKPRILMLDIETSPNLSWNWGFYEQTALAVVKEWEILSFAAKWLGDSPKNVTFIGQDTKSEKDLVGHIWIFLNQADVVVAHNGDAFDVKKINTKFLKYGLTPPEPYKTVDTKKVAKAYFAFNQNKLDSIGKYLDLGQKLKHSGISLWFDCMEGKAKAWKEMKEYNIQDIILLEKIYLRLRPWIKNHPNLNDYGEVLCCPKCQESHRLFRKGQRKAGTVMKQRYQCGACGGWFQTTVNKKVPVQNI